MESHPPIRTQALLRVKDPNALVERRVKVLWAKGKKYEGKVTRYDPSDGKHFVVVRVLVVPRPAGCPSAARRRGRCAGSGSRCCIVQTQGPWEGSAR